jgi:hypothetical protein
VSYGRCFLISLGCIFLAFSTYATLTHRQSVPSWGWLILLGFFLLGGVLIVTALFGSPDRIDQWADRASAHEAGLLVMVVAGLIYLLLRFLGKRR